MTREVIPDVEPVAPTSEALIEAAKSVVPVLRANALHGERIRRLPEANLQALESAGIFRMARQRRFGGYETDAATIGAVTALVASGCPSTAWVLNVYNGVAALMQWLDEQALVEAYAGSNARISGVFGRVGAHAHRVDSGYQIDGGGFWPFNSGCLDAEWDLLCITVTEDDGSTWVAEALVPMSDLTIQDDWYVNGACATGSNSVTCDELFIPAHRVARSPLHNPETTIRAIPADLIAAMSSALVLGMARYALESFVLMAPNRTLSGTSYDSVAHMPAAQTAVGRAAVNVHFIEAATESVHARLRRTVGGVDLDASALIKVTNARSLMLARETIELLYEVSPSSDIQLDKPIQRLLRDIHVFEHQAALSPLRNLESYGRHVLGMTSADRFVSQSTPPA